MVCTTAEENASPIRKKSEAEVLSPKLSRAATTIAEEAVDQLQASEKLIAGNYTNRLLLTVGETHVGVNEPGRPE